MTKNRRIILIILGIILIVFLEVFVYYYRFIREKGKTNISVIVYSDDKSWADLKEGAELAASKEDNVEVYFQIMSPTATAADQMAAINNEFAAEADRVIVAAVDSNELAKKLNGAYQSKLSFVVNGIDDKSYNVVSSDDFGMGYQLGKLIVDQEGDNIKVGIVHTDESKDCLNKRCEGLISAFDETSCSYSVWKKDNINGDIRSYTYGQIINMNADVIVIVSEGEMDSITSAVKDSSKNIPLYAIGHSDKAVYYLDSKQIKYLAYPDEFGEGYAAVTNSLSKLKHTESDNKISYKLICRDDMYSGEYEKLLFPFVK